MSTQIKRPRRIADLIQRHLALSFRKSIRDPRLAGLAITAVDVSPDLKQAKVFFSIVNPDEVKIVTDALEKASGRLRYLLAQSLDLRYTPKLIFVYDQSIDRVERLNQLLRDGSGDVAKSDEP